MLLVDDLLLAPVWGLGWIFRKIRDAAEEAVEAEADTITAELSELYMQLETGRITEAEFEAREQGLLDRLEVIRERTHGSGEDDDRETRD